jgi:hypothetical protein
MKRDMELIRNLLLEIESGNLNPAIEGYDNDALNFHKALLEEMGLVEAIIHYSSRGSITDIPDMAVIKRMTSDGHDFIQGIRDNEKWAKVKAFLKSAGKDVTLETMKYGIKQLFGVADA